MIERRARRHADLMRWITIHDAALDHGVDYPLATKYADGGYLPAHAGNRDAGRAIGRPLPERPNPVKNGNFVQVFA